MKKALIIFMAILLLLTGCSPQSSPKGTVSYLLNSLKEQKFEQAKGIISNYTEQDNYIPNTDSKGSQAIAASVYKRLYFKIAGVEKVSDSEAKVNVSIASVNMPDVYKKLMVEFSKSGLSDEIAKQGKTLDQFMTEKTEEIISKEELITKTITINVKKTGTLWKVEANDELISAMTGNSNIGISVQ